MASRMGPRSVMDATRFTSTTPHAASKAVFAAGAAPKAGSRLAGETAEERVRRLRQAHVAAQRAQISRMDRFIDRSRRFLDVAHRWTVGGIVAFTAVAGVISVYSVWDMLQYNRARRAEWVEAQKQMEADSLAAARVAYIKGDASEEQIELVERAKRQAELEGSKLPPLISPPEHRTHFEEHVQPSLQGSAGASGPGTRGVSAIFPPLWGSSQGSSGGGDDDQAPGRTVRTLDTKADPRPGLGTQQPERGGERRAEGLSGTERSGTAAGKKSWWPW